MKRALVAAALAIVLTGCNPAPEQEGAPTPPTGSTLEADLQSCGSGQRAVAASLEGTDAAEAASAIRQTVEACRSAAAGLRRKPMPGFDPIGAPAAVDRMADGLSEVADATAMMESSPSHARKKAQQGMRLYADGVAKLNESKQ